MQGRRNHATNFASYNIHIDSVYIDTHLVKVPQADAFRVPLPRPLAAAGPPPRPAHGLEISSLEEHYFQQGLAPYNQEDVSVSNQTLLFSTHSLCLSNSSALLSRSWLMRNNKANVQISYP